MITNGIQSVLKNYLPHNLSNSSIGNDSVISDTNTTQTQTESEDRVQDLAGYSSNTEGKTKESIIDESNINNNKKVVIRANNTEIASKVQYANRDSESWLQY